MAEIYLSMDDSGKLNKNEEWTVYAGLIFLSSEQRELFIRKYKRAVEDIKCGYCKEEKGHCSLQCPEVKSSSPLRKTDRRRLMNLIKKEYTYAIVIQNQKVYDHIINDKSARGRYIDFQHKLMVKKIVQGLLSRGILKRNDDLDLYLFFDEQPTVTDGKYSLTDSIHEELIHGIMNYNYSVNFRPILGGKLNISLEYYDSKYHYDIQASDVLAGTIRHIVIGNAPLSEKKRLVSEKTDWYTFAP